MRKLKLEMQLSIDGFCSAADGSTDWMVWDWQPEWNWDKGLQDYHTHLQTSSGGILLSRNMAAGMFYDHWYTMVQKGKGPQYRFAKTIVDMKKYVLSTSIRKSRWPNTEVMHGSLAASVNKLKRTKGKDLIVYGGASFVSSLIAADVIDDYHFIINPTILGKGKPIFKTIPKLKDLTLVKSKSFRCGVTMMHYKK